MLEVRSKKLLIQPEPVLNVTCTAVVSKFAKVVVKPGVFDSGQRMTEDDKEVGLGWGEPVLQKAGHGDVARRFLDEHGA